MSLCSPPVLSLPVLCQLFSQAEVVLRLELYLHALGEGEKLHSSGSSKYLPELVRSLVCAGPEKINKSILTESCLSCIHNACARSLQMKVDTVYQSCNLGTLSQGHQAIVF